MSQTAYWQRRKRRREATRTAFTAFYNIVVFVSFIVITYALLSLYSDLREFLDLVEDAKVTVRRTP